MARMQKIAFPFWPLLLLGNVAAFVVRNPFPSHVYTGTTRLMAKDDEVDKKQTAMNPLTRVSWYAVEAFGKAFGDKSKISTQEDAIIIDLEQPPQSMQETFQRIQLDNDRSYFLSGNVDKLIYDNDCVFADPFVSFAGRDRFVDNLQNLGSFITKYSAKMIDYTEENDRVKTRVMVKLELNLPWKPVLAWPWGVTYDIDPDTFLITKHEESWDIEPWEVSHDQRYTIV